MYVHLIFFSEILSLYQSLYLNQYVFPSCLQNPSHFPVLLERHFWLHSQILLLYASYHSELCLLQGSSLVSLYIYYQECKFIYLDISVTLKGSSLKSETAYYCFYCRSLEQHRLEVSNIYELCLIVWYVFRLQFKWLNKKCCDFNCWKCEYSLFSGYSFLITAAIYSEGISCKTSWKHCLENENLRGSSGLLEYSCRLKSTQFKLSSSKIIRKLIRIRENFHNAQKWDRNADPWISVYGFRTFLNLSPTWVYPLPATETRNSQLKSVNFRVRKDF